MIIRKGCCNGKRMNGFRSFGAAINDFDSFIAGVMGAGTDPNRMLLVVSEWLCGDYYARLFGFSEWFTPMVQVLTDSDAPAVKTTFIAATMQLVNGQSVHKDASCAGSGSTTGSSSGMSVEDIIKLGEKGTKDIIDLLDGDGNKTPPTNTPPGTSTGSGTPAPKKATNWMTFVALGAAGLAAVMLLPKKK